MRTSLLVSGSKIDLQWGTKASLTDSWTYYPIPFTSTVYGILGQQTAPSVTSHAHFNDVNLIKFHYKVTQYLYVRCEDVTPIGERFG